MRILQLLLLCTLLSFHAKAQRQMENLNRGVVAVRTSSSQVYISWRLFGTDPPGIAFNVYRLNTKINTSPIINSTNFTDNTTTRIPFRQAQS